MNLRSVGWLRLCRIAAEGSASASYSSAKKPKAPA